MDNILPGPVSNAIIFDNSYHVSEEVWDGRDRGPLECFCGNRNMRLWVLSNAQKRLLHRIGFGVFANPTIVLQNDARLVTALVERWRPETNTFFMRRGEMTVTLQDVGYILGLPLIGMPIVGDGADTSIEYFARNWFEPLDDAEVKRAFTRGGVKYTWLYERYGRAAPGPDRKRIAIHTQAYLFLIVGSVLFPTTSRNVVHTRYIKHLRILKLVPLWSWGSAVLCYLYRGLEHAAQKGAKKIACCTWLLQLWCYERFVIGRPIPDPTRDSYPVAKYWARHFEVVVPPEEEEEVEVEPKGKKGKKVEVEVEAKGKKGKGKGKKVEVEVEPKGKEGKKGKDSKEVKGKDGKEVKGKGGKGKGKGKGKEEDIPVEDIPEEDVIGEEIVVGAKRKRERRDSRLAPHHSLPHYRGEFDGVAADVVTWTPYARFHEVEEDADGDHDISFQDWEAHFAGLARVPVLHYDYVEYQHSDRVLRQFGLPQPIPRSPVSMTEYRRPKIPFNPWDWRAIWYAEIGEWNRFVQHPEFVVAHYSELVEDPGYMQWFSEIARMRVGKPDPVPHLQYSTRELFDNSRAFELVSISSHL